MCVCANEFLQPSGCRCTKIVRVCVCERERERERECVCVRERERERERVKERMCVHACARMFMCACACSGMHVCMCEGFVFLYTSISDEARGNSYCGFGQ